jgi:hypothetical protein
MQRLSRDWPEGRDEEGSEVRGAAAVSVGSDIGDYCAVSGKKYGTKTGAAPVERVN